MKVKIISTLSILTLFIACGGQVEWNMQQRAAMREALEDYRQMIYLANLPSEEFILFNDGVIEDIEVDYPQYTEFIKLPSVNDTIDLYVVTAIVDELQADVANMRYLMPYESLVADGVLPPALSHDEQRAFYGCMAQGVNNNYIGFTSFINSIIDNNIPPAQIDSLISDCAGSLFDWSVTIIEE